MRRSAFQKNLKSFGDLRKAFIEDVVFDLFSCDRNTLKVTYEMSVHGKVQGLLDCRYADMAGWISGVHDESLRRTVIPMDDLRVH